MSTTELCDRLATAGATLFDRTVGDGREGVGLYPGVGAGVLLFKRGPARRARLAGKPYIWSCTTIDASNVRAAADAVALIALCHGELDPATKRAFAAFRKPTVAIAPVAIGAFTRTPVVTVDGTRGLVTPQACEVETGAAPAAFETDLRALAGEVPVRVVAEASTAPTIARAVTLGADGVRIDLDAILVCSPVLETLQAYLMAPTAHARHAKLDELVALVARGCRNLLYAARGLKRATVAIGGRP